MPRMARVVLPGIPHHVTQRGSRRCDVFQDDADRCSYVEILGDSARRYGLRIHAYCLMTNHVHFVVTPECAEAIAETFQRAHGMYAARFNIKYGLCGHLWQARPYSCVLDEKHFWAAVRYVERNPVRAGMVGLAQEYAWSSAAAHCGLTNDSLLEEPTMGESQVRNWGEWLRKDGAAEADRRIRDRTFTGRPCGDAAFVQTAEKLLGRPLACKKPGPRSKQESSEPEMQSWTTDEIRF